MNTWVYLVLEFINKFIFIIFNKNVLSNKWLFNNIFILGTQLVHIIGFYWLMQLQVHCVFTNVYQLCKFLYSSCHNYSKKIAVTICCTPWYFYTCRLIYVSFKYSKQLFLLTNYGFYNLHCHKIFFLTKLYFSYNFASFLIFINTLCKLFTYITRCKYNHTLKSKV